MNRSFYILGLLIFLVSFQNCKNKSSGVAPSVDPVDSTDSPFLRSVLLLDFKGHKCGNCPSADDIAKQLNDSYGEDLVVVTAHVGTLALPQPPASGKFTTDFRTPIGNTLDNEFGASLSGVPKGTVNYMDFGGSRLLTPSDWGSKVNQELQDDTADFGFEVELSISSNVLNLQVTCMFKDSISGQFNLGAYLTEDSIVDWQKDYRLSGSQDIEDYKHDYVLRGNFYSPGNPQVLPWGISLGDSAFGPLAPSIINLETTLDSEWNQDKLNIVVFVYDGDSESILQVKEFHLAEEI